jgi:CRP/FNR family transcriptional regulator, cyclic AMP receptor protein
MAEDQEKHFDYRAFIAKHGGGAVSKFTDKHTVYAQGDSADALFYIVSGSVKVTIFSEYGKEAVIGMT